jgi:hypothetical protein
VLSAHESVLLYEFLQAGCAVCLGPGRDAPLEVEADRGGGLQRWHSLGLKGETRFEGKDYLRVPSLGTFTSSGSSECLLVPLVSCQTTFTLLLPSSSHRRACRSLATGLLNVSPREVWKCHRPAESLSVVPCRVLVAVVFIH